MTAANRAIVFDHWWHEGWERQAFARVHRIGQTKEVHTAKLVAAGSMDETILAMQAAKREKIGAVVGYGEARPKFNEICDALYKEGGSVDKELARLARVDDITDDNESDGFSGSDDGDDDDDGSSDSESDSESGSGSEGEGEGEGEGESDSVNDDGDESDADSKN